MVAASAGVVCGLYSGATQSANCFVGYNVRQSGGATVVVPFVNGAEVGTVFTLLRGHTYTLRIRLHCVEMQRVLQTLLRDGGWRGAVVWRRAGFGADERGV